MSAQARRGWVCIPLALLLASLLLFPALAQGGIHVTIQRLETKDFPQVTAYVSVADEHGLALANIQPNELKLLEDGKLLPLERLSALQRVERAVPLYIAMAIDTSGSMHDRPIADAKTAASAFVDTLRADDRVALIRFDQGVTTTLDFSSDHAAIKRAITAIETLRPGTGATRLYKAAITAIEKTSQGPVGQRIVLILSDGHDTGPEMGMDLDLSPEVVIDRAQKASVALFTVAIDRGKPGEGDFLTVLRNMSEATGGLSYVVKGADTADLTGKFQAIGELLKWQYQVAYTSTVPADNKSHTLGVQVRGQPNPPAEMAFVAPRVPPTIRIAGLSAGQELIGNVTLSVEEARGADLSRVEFLLDGTSLGEVTAPPFVFIWDSTTAQPGQHTLSVAAIDAAGNSGTYSVTVRVRDPLILTIVRPAEGAELASPYEVEVQVEHLAPLERIDYWVDIVPITSTTKEGPLRLNLHAFSGGTHKLTVRVYDQAGRMREASVNFALPESGPNYPLIVMLTVLGLALVVGVIVAVTAGRRRRLAGGAAGRDTVVSMPVLPSAVPTSGVPPAPPAGPSAEPPTQQRLPVVGGAGDTHVATPVVSDTRVAMPVIGAGRRARREPETELAMPVLAPPAWLVIKEGSGVGHRFPLNKDRLVLGRSPQCEIVIDDPAVSNWHAAVVREGDDFYIQDLASTNGTFVSGERISGPQALQEGIEVRVGKTILVFKKL